MSAGRLAAKLLLSPRDMATATPVRPKSGSGRWGAPPAGGAGFEPEPGAQAFHVFPYQESAGEQLRGGKDTGTTTYRLWCLLGANGEAPASRDDYLEVEGEGVVNVTGAIKRPTEGLCRLDAVRVGG